MKRILCLFLSAIISVSSLGCASQYGMVADDTNIVDDVVDETYELQNELLALPNVDSVEMISQDDGEFLAQYLITFIQPVDWTDFSKGSFPQRVLLGYKGKDHPNSFEVSGYCFFDVVIPGTPIIAGKGELTTLCDCNCIMMEYRYFGKSRPDNAEEDRDKAEYWTYMTTANASSDFANIIHTIKDVLPGRSFFSGVSKGGYTTNAFCMYEYDETFAPEYKESVAEYGKWDNNGQYKPSIDAYVSYVAPLCDGPQDPRFMKNLFETIGDQGYDAQTAQDKRNLVMDFMIEALKNRNPIQDWYYQKCIDDGNELRPFCTKEILYDVAVLEFATQFWQYGSDFANIEKVLSMQQDDGINTDEYVKEIYNLILAMNDPSTWSPSFAAFPYYVQATCEMGEHSLDFSYLRKELVARGLEDYLFVTPEMEDNLLQKMVFSDDMLNSFSYDSGVRDAILKWSKTTTAPIIQIQGGCDTWNAVSLSTEDNPSFNTYVVASGSHSSRINDLSPEDREKCMNSLDLAN